MRATSSRVSLRGDLVPLYDVRPMASKRSSAKHTAKSSTSSKRAASAAGKVLRSDRAMSAMVRKTTKHVVTRYGDALRRLERY